MAVAWHTSLSFNPPLYGIAVASKRFTYQFIIDSKEFAVNFLPFKASELIASIGGTGGQEIDKFQRFNIAKSKPVKTAVPILEAAYAAYECKLIASKDYGDHRWLVEEIVAVHLREKTFTTEGFVDLDKVNPALYLGNEYYLTATKNTIRRLDREAHGKC